jgi:hypothetical protein
LKNEYNVRQWTQDVWIAAVVEGREQANGWFLSENGFV